MAIFLVTGGLLSSVSIFHASTGIIETTSPGQKGVFFISAAQGAENITALFGEQIATPLSAVSEDNAPNQRIAFFVASGAIKDSGDNIDWKNDSLSSGQASSLNR